MFWEGMYLDYYYNYYYYHYCYYYYDHWWVLDGDTATTVAAVFPVHMKSWMSLSENNKICDFGQNKFENILGWSMKIDGIEICG